MVAAEQKRINRAALHKAIDELSDENLAEIITIMEYLQFKQQTRTQGSPWAKELYDLFAPVRAAVAESGMSSDEIDQLLDEELEEVRRERNP
jgi:hypothetical protein